MHHKLPWGSLVPQLSRDGNGVPMGRQPAEQNESGLEWQRCGAAEAGTAVDQSKPYGVWSG
ncbi:MAG TPA: hypothetical protein VFQ79_14645, partial [Bryobacteraceae bacterium]|nr:hypothetical protein [Bryobacteraceae bacterium]